MQTAVVKIKELSAAEKACLGCSLPICDDKSKACAFVKITGSRKEYFANRYRERRGPVEPKPRRSAFSDPETRAKALETKKRLKLERMRAALEKKRTAKMWARRQQSSP